MDPGSLSTPEPKAPARHRRSLVLAAALLLVGAVALSTELIPIVTKTQPTVPVAGVETSPSSSPTIDDPTASASIVTDVPTVGDDPTAAPTKKPTPKPTRKPTPRPTARPTTKATPAMYATWISITAANPPTFNVKTRAGAICAVTRTWGGTHSRTSPTFTANASGVASYTWSGPTWTSGTVYTVTAKCTLDTAAATTAARDFTIP